MNKDYITPEALEHVKENWPAAYYYLVSENLKQEKLMLEWELTHIMRSPRRIAWINQRLEDLKDI